VRKTAALAGAVGVGYFGGMEGVAGDVHNHEKDGPKSTHREGGSSLGKRIESSNTFDVLERDKQFTWGIEYVPKQEVGGGFIAERYVKINNKTGETTVLGEYNNVLEAGKSISAMPDVPEKVRSHAQYASNAIQTEKNFQASGLTEPTGNREGKTYVAEKEFEGYGIKAKTTVEVDEAGKVVRLVGVDKAKGKDWSSSQSEESDSEKIQEDTGKLTDYERAQLEKVRKTEKELKDKGYIKE
jgi:hypothetical protein